MRRSASVPRPALLLKKAAYVLAKSCPKFQIGAPSDITKNGKQSQLHTMEWNNKEEAVLSFYGISLNLYFEGQRLVWQQMLNTFLNLLIFKGSLRPLRRGPCVTMNVSSTWLRFTWNYFLGILISQGVLYYYAPH